MSIPPPPKKFFNPVSIDYDTYKSGDVDFYNQALDLRTVTGVGVDDDGGDSTDLKEYGIAGEDGGESPTQDDALDALGAKSISGDFVGGSMFPEGTGIEYNKFDYQQFGTYSDYLSTEKPPGYDDRLGTITNIIEPLVDGRLSDINWSAQSKALSERIENMDTKAISMDKKDAVRAGLTAAAGLPGAILGSIATSDTSYKNAFNEDQPKMSGVFGLISDTVAATQYQDMAHNRAVANAFAADYNSARDMDLEVDEDAFATVGRSTDFGFSMKFGSGTGAGGITRKAGTFTYTGNMKGLDNQTLKNIEAVQRGFIPSTFGRSNFGFDYTGRGATTFEGGGYSDAITGNGDRYTDDGKYMDGFGRVSMMGRASDMINLAKSHGITEDQAKKAVQDARAGKGTVRSNIASMKQATETAKIVAEKTTKAAKAAEADRQAGIDRAANERAYAEARARQIADRDEGPGGGDNEGPSNEGGQADSGSGGGQVGSEEGGFDGAMGGQVTAKGFRRYAMGGTAYPQKEAYTSGFVDRPPSQVSEAGKVADDKPLKAPEGSFVLNAAAIEHMGEADVRKMIMDAQKEAVRRGVSTGDFERHSDLIDIAISSGEAIVAPHLVKIIGEDRLEKINKRGLRKTEERVQRTKQEKPVAVRRGGFLT